LSEPFYLCFDWVSGFWPLVKFLLYLPEIYLHILSKKCVHFVKNWLEIYILAKIVACKPDA